MQYIFGIDVGGTSVKIGLFGEDAALIEKWEIKTRKEDGGSKILPDIAASIQEKAAEHDISKEQIIGAGVGVPGPVNAHGEVLECVNLGWGRVDVEKKLGELLGVPVKAANDANVAALGEMWQGGAKGHENLILVTLGTGVGGGIVVDGKVIAGSHGAGGELGHSQINMEETKPCNCGKCGCLEQYASATGIVNEAKKALKDSETKSSLRAIAPLTAKAIFDEAKAGDMLAMEQVEKLGYNLGLALANFCAVVDPEVIVIGGGVSKAGQIIPDTIQKYFKKYAFNATKVTEFVLAELGNDAGIYGSAKLILG